MIKELTYFSPSVVLTMGSTLMLHNKDPRSLAAGIFIWNRPQSSHKLNSGLS